MNQKLGGSISASEIWFCRIGASFIYKGVLEKIPLLGLGGTGEGGGDAGIY